MKIFDGFQQQSPEWWAIRRGLPTASAFDRIITPARGEASKQQEGYINELVAEMFDQQYSREPDRGFVSQAMQDGIDGEPAARLWYEFDRGVEVRQVGFCKSDCERYGCSPDGLIGDDGVLELKRPILKTFIGYLRDGGLPLEYKAQVHGELVVTGRQWCDFVAYSPVGQFDSLVVRVTWDEFTDKMQREVIAFCDRLDFVKEKLGIRSAANVA